jgi:hypothetical protein
MQRPCGFGAVAVTAAVCLLAVACSATGQHPAAAPARSGRPTSTGPADAPAAAEPAPARVTSSAARATTPVAPWDHPLRAHARKGHLHRGSHPGVLPGDLLIADKFNDRLLIVDRRGRIRWRFPRPGDLRPGQTFLVPDDAFFTADGRYIVVTEEDDFVVRIVDVVRHQIVYQYGRPGTPGDTPNRLWNPDDAIQLPNGDLVLADIKNQRILVIAKGRHHPAKAWGDLNHGYHDPPRHYGAPNGAFPMRNGNLLVTEIRGDGRAYWSTHPPGVAYPSDSNEVAPNRLLTVDYSSPGQIVMFTRHGRTLWRFRPLGANALDHPSIALPLPNGDIVASDDYNHRVVVVDPRTHRVVWQYGHTGIPGSRPGYLDNPDGVDLVPPYSLVDRTTRRWPRR